MRLDHLLSKEHTPGGQAPVLVRLVVFTSGIVDEWLVLVGGSPEYYPIDRWLVGCGKRWRAGGWGSRTHCWVLKDQVRDASGVFWLFPSLSRVALVWVVWGVGGVVV